MSVPLVSVVIPTYKHRDFVLATLESVWAQTFQDFEVIVVNDGSPDDTGALLAPLAASGRIRYVEQSNQGQGAARNRGIAQARGAFIALLDDDDLWPPDKLEWQVRALERHPDVGVVFGWPDPIDDAGRPVVPCGPQGKPLPWPYQAPSGDVYAALCAVNFIKSPGQCLIRRAALKTLQGSPFDPRIWGCDDWDLWLRLAEGWPFLFVDKAALRYRLHTTNASRDDLRMHQNMLVVYRKHRRRSRGDASRRVCVAAKYAEFAQTSGGHMLFLASLNRAQNEPRAALAKLTYVLRLRPERRTDKAFLRLWLGTCKRAVIARLRRSAGQSAG